MHRMIRTTGAALFAIAFLFHVSLPQAFSQHDPVSINRDRGDVAICKILEEYVNTPADFKDVAEDKIYEKFEYGPVPALVAGIQKFDQPIRIGAVGVRKWRKDTPITIHDNLILGSCTKALTATMLGRLIDKGELKFESTIAECLPDLVDKIHPEYHATTLHQLLTHTGNVPREGRWHEFTDLDVTKQRTAIVADKLKIPPALKDNRWIYSNFGYVVAAAMATSATGKSWEQLMKDEIFTPLKMESAGFGAPDPQGRMLSQPWGHLIFGDMVSPVNVGLPESMGPCGTIHLSMTDWGKYALAIAGAGKTKIVAEATRKRLLEITAPIQAVNGKYSCGWFVDKQSWSEGTIYWHGGTNGKWVSHVFIDQMQRRFTSPYSMVGLTN